MYGKKKMMGGGKMKPMMEKGGKMKKASVLIAVGTPMKKMKDGGKMAATPKKKGNAMVDKAVMRRAGQETMVAGTHGGKKAMKMKKGGKMGKKSC